MLTKNITNYIRKVYINYGTSAVEKGRLDTFDPVTFLSKNFMNWRAKLDMKTCAECRNLHGMVLELDEVVDFQPPLHNNCRCAIVPLDAVAAGNATKNGEDGADFWLKYSGELPDYYISFESARKVGWRWGESPAKYIPGKMLFGGVYANNNMHLPHKNGRIWYEADINYYEGKRNGHRILWSNDGLIFVTYNHYETFCEIV